MVVVAIHNRHIPYFLVNFPGKGEAAESASYDHKFFLHTSKTHAPASLLPCIRKNRRALTARRH